MRKLIAIALVMALLLSLVACSNKTIGKISGPENDCITIDDVKYNRDTNHNFSNADKGKYLGKVSNSKITMRVYSVKGDTEGEYIYALWNWSLLFSFIESTFPIPKSIDIFSLGISFDRINSHCDF